MNLIRGSGGCIETGATAEGSGVEQSRLWRLKLGDGGGGVAIPRCPEYPECDISSPQMTKNSEREGTEKTKRVQETILDVTKSSEERKNRGCRKGKWIKRTRMKKRLSSVIL